MKTCITGGGFMRFIGRVTLLSSLVVGWGWAAAAGGTGKDCSVTSVGFIPLTDLGAGLYLGQFQGGLYPGGSNAIPPMHFAAGRARALSIVPLDTAGSPAVNGRIVLLSIGMSNTTQEFCSDGGFQPCNTWTFMGKAAVDPRVNHATLAIANGARGGQEATTWDDPADPNYDRVRDDVLVPQGLSEAQVQAVWIKQANPQPMVSLPDLNADAYHLLATLGDIVRAVGVRYPNCRIVFLSNRIYAGYAGFPTPISTLNPEPYAYESGWAVKGLIEAQIIQMASGAVDPRAGDLDYNTVAPLLAWGPDLWADGQVARSDGLTYACDDLQDDGTHPATGAEDKVGTLLLDFMLTSRLATPWFRRCELGDLNHDGRFDARDVQPFIETFLMPDAAVPRNRCAADCSDDGIINAADLGAFVGILLAG